MTPKPLTARAEGGTHDGEKFEISEETVGLLLNSRRDATVLEYYEVVLYMGGNLLAFVRDYEAAEWRDAIASRPNGITDAQTARGLNNPDDESRRLTSTRGR